MPKTLATLSAALAALALLAACGQQENGGSQSQGATSSATPRPGGGAGGTDSGNTPGTVASGTPAAPPQAASAAPGTVPQGQGTNPTSDGTPAPSANPAVTMGAGPDNAGMSVYMKACAACHGAGVAGAPRLGDKADWGLRIQQGMNVLYQHAIQGYTGKKGVMPPKGGFANLSDAEVRQAVDYMVAQGR
ncbi:c-type cytochrome [Ramlibacter tataouinensis]|uniref:Cytochrome c domain-containing protein n=1 Tax=Ramlibacter tataouinensis (strain ATCC BAA-407 / DSM 14655 / LMG 21543 / TTB310) TaxID=365046 RepID=F5Y692_RAMTT|nr:c-type cytochrome [Ramlibacter tataouinensis]AEG92778.1 hypothetical protein Rta_16860 [Ramlibacter tataouinensis TTB310]